MEFAEGLATAAVRISLPILLLVLGEIVAERAGVLNIGLEGMLLVGAFAGFAGAVTTGSPLGGLAFGVVASAGLALAFGILVVRLAFDPIVTGVALNIFAAGITGVLFRSMTSGETATLFVETFGPLPLPGLSGIPVLGPSVFSMNALGYLAVGL
ncbi:MAG: ABC transporter permease, partial [Gemmatimonadetes bacterium]|nr:ABC transporter permease [Gemmatimonadota bacterium]